MSKTKDTLRIIQHLTWRRLLNLLVLKSSYLLSRIIKYPIVWGKPFSISIEPTTACNLACPECPSGLKQFTRATGKLSLETNQKILTQVSRTVFYINYYFQGEPFLHPQFLEFIHQAKRHKIYTSTSTNAHFIDRQKAEEIVDSGLDRLIISIDGTTQETYESYRVNGNLHKVIMASRLLVDVKKERNSSTPHLIFQFLAVKHNEHEISAVFSLGKQLGIDEVRIKTAQFNDFMHGNPLLPENERYSRYKLQADGTYRLKYKTGNHCWRMWSGSVFTWDAKVVPCCFDKDAKYVLGSLSEADFSTVWMSKEYKSFRKSILTGRNKIDICQNCSEGAKVWI